MTIAYLPKLSADVVNLEGLLDNIRKFNFGQNDLSQYGVLFSAILDPLTPTQQLSTTPVTKQSIKQKLIAHMKHCLLFQCLATEAMTLFLREKELKELLLRLQQLSTELSEKAYAEREAFLEMERIKQEEAFLMQIQSELDSMLHSTFHEMDKMHKEMQKWSTEIDEYKDDKKKIRKLMKDNIKDIADKLPIEKINRQALEDIIYQYAKQKYKQKKIPYRKEKLKKVQAKKLKLMSKLKKLTPVIPGFPGTNVAFEQQSVNASNEENLRLQQKLQKYIKKESKLIKDINEGQADDLSLVRRAAQTCRTTLSPENQTVIRDGVNNNSDLQLLIQNLFDANQAKRLLKDKHFDKSEQFHDLYHHTKINGDKIVKIHDLGYRALKKEKTRIRPTQQIHDLHSKHISKMDDIHRQVTTKALRVRQQKQTRT